jgi:hypothetical protein
MIKSKKTCLLCKCEVLDSNPSPTKKKKKKKEKETIKKTGREKQPAWEGLLKF